MTTLTFHGHATLSLESGGTTLLVDPFFTDNPATEVDAATVSPDVILVTHGHFDHVGHVSATTDRCQTDLVDIAVRTGCRVVCNFEIAQWLLRNGVENVHAMHLGGAHTFDWGHCKMTPALHGSMLPDGSDGGAPGGFLLTLADAVIYIAGDTALFSDMQLIGNLPGDARIDLAVLPVGDNFTMGPDDALLAAGYLDAAAVLPVHHGTWPLIEQDVAAWAKLVEEDVGSKGVLLQPGESVDVVGPS